MVHNCTNKKVYTLRHRIQDPLGLPLTSNSNLQPVTQINTPTKQNYFQFPLCSHCFKTLFFECAVSDIWNDSPHYISCCVPAKFILKNLILVSVVFGHTALENANFLSLPHTSGTTWLLIASVFPLHCAHRIILELWLPPLISCVIITWCLCPKRCAVRGLQYMCLNTVSVTIIKY